MTEHETTAAAELRAYNRQRVLEELSMALHRAAPDDAELKGNAVKVMDSNHNLRIAALADLFLDYGYGLSFRLTRRPDELHGPEVEGHHA